MRLVWAGPGTVGCLPGSDILYRLFLEPHLATTRKCDAGNLLHIANSLLRTAFHFICVTLVLEKSAPVVRFATKNSI